MKEILILLNKLSQWLLWINEFVNFVGCGSVTIANGEVEYLNGTDYGAVARIRCSDGYDLTSSETVMCLDKGTWNKTADHCVIKGNYSHTNYQSF